MSKVIKGIMVIEASIGNYLQNLRKERKISLREVADHIDI
jgi:cytoskeletal protein RodZ